MFVSSPTKDTFISGRANNCCFTNQKAEKQITLYLPDLTSEKVYEFFIACPKKMFIVINNDEDKFWASDKRTFVLPGIPGSEARIRSMLGKWQITSNITLTFR